jgi:hypothetical protein
MKPFASRSIAAIAVVLTACGSASAQSSLAASVVSRSVADSSYPAAFVASLSNSTGTAGGLAVFSSSDGRLLRWLLHSKSQPTPVAVSPSGTWVYYYYPAAANPRCPSGGFVEPLLWRLRVTGGRPQRTDIHTTDLAFSPDGKMLAYTSELKCGRTLLIVVRNQRTGATRRIIAAHNDLSGNGVITEAELSWAPDDVHLAVATEAAAALNALQVIDTRRTTDITRAPVIGPCASPAASTQVGCLNPGFDVHGRLTFLRWLESPGQSGEWVVRWQNRRATRLFRLSRALAFSAGISVDRTGNAILLLGEYGGPDDVWRWSNGSLSLIRRSAGRLLLTSPLWLR